VPGKWTVALSGGRRVSGAENHPDKAWSDELGCQRGAGMPYECNRRKSVMSVGMIGAADATLTDL
jgi:hypothetical protein